MFDMYVVEKKRKLNVNWVCVENNISISNNFVIVSSAIMFFDLQLVLLCWSVIRDIELEIDLASRKVERMSVILIEKDCF